MTNIYQPLFDKLDATIAAIEGSPVENPVMDDAVDLLRRLGITAASLLNGSVQAFSHLILDPVSENEVVPSPTEPEDLRESEPGTEPAGEQDASE